LKSKNLESGKEHENCVKRGSRKSKGAELGEH